MILNFDLKVDLIVRSSVNYTPAAVESRQRHCGFETVKTFLQIQLTPEG